MTFHVKTYINAFPFNGLKCLLVICLPLKRFRKSLEHLLEFSLWPFKALGKSLKAFPLFVKSVSKSRSNFPSMALTDLESVRKVVKLKRCLFKFNVQRIKC